MSSGIAFLSSPMQSNYTPLHYRTSFSTPQQHRFNLFKPTSPSPLQTSRNANTMSNPFFTKTDQDQETSSKSVEQIDNSTTDRPFFFLNQPSTNESTQDNTRAAQFQYESRARSSSPSIQLQTHMTANRDSRKKLFLNRLRNRRDDARFQRNGDQILRMDWLNERRAWEQQMAQNVISYQDEDLDVEIDMQEHIADQDVSSTHPETGDPALQLDEGYISPTEDKELEDLVSYFDEARDEFDAEDDDYDALFIEVLSQQHDADHANSKADVEMG